MQDGLVAAPWHMLDVIQRADLGGHPFELEGVMDDAPSGGDESCWEEEGGEEHHTGGMDRGMGMAGGVKPERRAVGCHVMSW